MKIKVDIGNNLNDVIEQACNLATEKSCTVKFDFNDWSREVQPGETPEEVYNSWRKFQEKEEEKWLRSDEGKEFLEQQAKLQKRRQMTLDQAVKNWPNFQDIESVLKWCHTIFVNLVVDTKVDREKILDQFKAAGMTPNMNTGVFYVAECKQNSGLYLIGQFLEGIKKKGIPEVFDFLYSEWSKK